jgi:hypothetical protein
MSFKYFIWSPPPSFRLLYVIFVIISKSYKQYLALSFVFPFPLFSSISFLPVIVYFSNQSEIALRIDGRHTKPFSVSCLPLPFPIPSLPRCLAGPSSHSLIFRSCRGTWVEVWLSLFPATRVGWIVYFCSMQVAWSINSKIQPWGLSLFSIYSRAAAAAADDLSS